MDQLAESINDDKTVVVVEWAGIVKNVLPDEHLSIEFKPVADNPEERLVTFRYGGSYIGLIKQLETAWPESRP
jgi:tRNA A37 threonylcarbamoyladenosine biosynthesis protein TsaE